MRGACEGGGTEGCLPELGVEGCEWKSVSSSKSDSVMRTPKERASERERETESLCVCLRERESARL
eukprot:250674-Rhodomonas_salina.3